MNSVVEPNQQSPYVVCLTVLVGQAEAPKYSFNEKFNGPLFPVLAPAEKLNSKGRPFMIGKREWCMNK